MSGSTGPGPDEQEAARRAALDSVTLPWKALVEACLDANGVHEIYGSWHEHAYDRMWIASDVGLLECYLVTPSEGPVRVSGELTSWRDVIEPSLMTETLLVGGQPHTTAHLFVKLPRLDITESNSYALRFHEPFIRALMTRAGR